MKFTTLASIAFVIVIVSTLAPTEAVVVSGEKVTCDPIALQPCLPAVMSGSQPTTECCGKLKEQQSCFCDYIKNPIVGQYLSDATARRILGACSVPYPTCWSLNYLLKEILKFNYQSLVM